uniref:Major facilitator superfamily (MFS) profile domain-containing protein n=1 Tax=Ditylenchus dipsaci TaxID=166011 RepID=A0A915E4T2_9BILA
MLKTKYYVAVLTSTLGASTQFYSNNVVNPSQAIVTTWITKLTWSAQEIHLACIPLGAIFGALSTNLITKKVGRRNGLFANGVLNVLGACLVYFAKPVNAPELLIVGRLILGANVGLGSGIVPMYLMEITPLKYRGAAGTAHEIAIAFSDSFSMLMALPEILGDEHTFSMFTNFELPGKPQIHAYNERKREKAMSDLKKLVDSEQAKSMIDALDQEAHNLSENRPTFADLFSKELRLPCS